MSRDRSAGLRRLRLLLAIASIPLSARAEVTVSGPAGLLGTIASPSFQAGVSLAAHSGTVLVGSNDQRYPWMGGYMRWLPDSNLCVDGLPFPFPSGWVGSGAPAFAVWDDSGSAVFYWAQLAIAADGQTQVALFRSVDGGDSWAGPFTITPTASPGEVPDRPAIAVDPETGRLFLAWTQFQVPQGIRVAYSDDAATGDPPTWSTAVPVASRPQDGQTASIAVDPASNDVYLAWVTFWADPLERGVAISRSIDNGATWTLPADILPRFTRHIAPYGFDRFLWSGGSYLAWNASTNTLVTVYAAAVTGTPDADFGDIFFRRSTNRGLTWSPPQPLNAFPGLDRAQCFPAVACSRTGRIDVTWYDQSAGSDRSDDTDLMYCFSNDNGLTWSSPVPVTSSPMHCESGNDFGFPHQGDYNDIAADDGPEVTPFTYAGFAGFARPGPFTTGADAFAFRAEGVQVAPLRIRPGSVLVGDNGCSRDDGELVANEIAALTIPLENIGRVPLTGISATLSTTNLKVIIRDATRSYPGIAAGGVAVGAGPFSIGLTSDFVCGTPIDFRLDITTASTLPTYREFSLPSGVVLSTTVLLSENFDGVEAPALPPGWATLDLGSSPNDWVTTTTTPRSAPNAAFVPIAFANTFGCLQGPPVAIPPGIDYVEIAFDTQHDLRQLDARWSPDGASLSYQLDGVGANHFASGDATEIDYRYTHNVVPTSGSNAGNRSAWSGVSGGYQSVRFRIPDLAGHSITPRFDFTTAGAGTGGVGWWVDNFVITAYTTGCGDCTPTPTSVVPMAPGNFAAALAGPNPFRHETALRYTLPERGRVRVELFGLGGQRLRVLTDGVKDAGTHVVAIPRASRSGVRLPTGLYLVRTQALGHSRTVRVVVLE